MKNISKMTTEELNKKVIENRIRIRETSDLAEQRKLIKENHLILTELDTRWILGEMNK